MLMLVMTATLVVPTVVLSVRAFDPPETLRYEYSALEFFVFCVATWSAYPLTVHFVAAISATIGQRLLGLRIMRIDGHALGLRTALWRYAPEFVLLSFSLREALASCWYTVPPLHPLLDPFRQFDEAWEIYGLVGQPPWFALAFVALVAWLVLDAAVMVVHPRHRALKDLIAGTIVVQAPDVVGSGCIVSEMDRT